jgi:hypothetical protein
MTQMGQRGTLQEGLSLAAGGGNAPIPAIPAIVKRGPDPKGTLGTGSVGLAVGSVYLAVATGVDHLEDEFGVARQDAPVDRAGGGDDLAVAAQ